MPKCKACTSKSRLTRVDYFSGIELKTKYADAKVLSSLVKLWLQELKDDMEELQAHFIFKRDLVVSLKQISCNLCSSYNHMIDGFTPCQVFYILMGCLSSGNCPFFIRSVLFGRGLWEHCNYLISSEP